MSSIIYVISTILIFLTYTFLKKSNKKENVTASIIINLILLMCYNCVICLIYTIINIPITLISLSIINIIISLLFIFIMIKTKEIQKYKFKLKTFISICIILFISIIVSLQNFSTDLNIKYIMTDSAIHYKAAREFYESDTLLCKTEYKDTSGEFQIGAYVNTGILFKIFKPIINKIDLYKIFICFDIFIYSLSGIMMYLIIEKFVRVQYAYILSMICICLFILGYPLNCMIFGFVYFQLGLILVETIFYVFLNSSKKESKINEIIKLFLLNFGLTFSYIILTIPIFIAEGIYFLFKYKKEEGKIINKKFITTISITLILPTLIGMLYFVLPQLLKEKQPQEFVTSEGYIYRNYWSGFIFLLPISIFCFKRKNIQFYKIQLIVLIIFMIAIFTATVLLELSTYYYCKYNFMLWFVLWLGVIVTINSYLKSRKFKYVMTTFVYIYWFFAILLIFNTIPVVKDRFPTEKITNAFDIYGINSRIIYIVKEDYNKEEIELLKYINDELDVKNNNILFLTGPRQEYWLYGFFEIKNRDDMQKYIKNEELDKWNNNEKYKYALVLYDRMFYIKQKNGFEPKKILYQNEKGAIYENN